MVNYFLDILHQFIITIDYLHFSSYLRKSKILSDINGRRTLRGPTNVVILENNRAKFNASLCEVDDLETELCMDEQCVDTKVLIPMEEASSTAKEETDKGIHSETGKRFFNELYDKEVDIKRNFNDQEILDIRTAVNQQVNLLVDAIGEIDPRFRIREVIPVGSSREGTQIVRPCEYDYILVLGSLSTPGAVSLKPVPPVVTAYHKGEPFKVASLKYMHVKFEDSELKSLFDENVLVENVRGYLTKTFIMAVKSWLLLVLFYFSTKERTKTPF